MVAMFLSRCELCVLAVVSLCCIAVVRSETCLDDVKHGDTFLKTLNKFKGKVYKTKGIHENGDTYDYKIGICTRASDDHGFEECAVVQEKSEKGEKKSVCVGRLNATTVVESPGGWIELHYGNGTSYNNHCHGTGRSARILFDCDQFAGKGNPVFVEENNEDNLCYYLFYWRTREMCDKSLSPGAIILIIFAVVLAILLVGMVGGFLYLRFVVGAKGYEQIPFYSHFVEFGNLQADGCDLVCRSRGSVPACIQKPPIITDKTTAPNRDLDSETDEDDRDDTLLPM
ncbi:cation-dependent mannose-6-phosphate receptor-like [Dysidea avara]|uniref:cation-dependent mannose-6-phosphate receptor-like n=1 Tax=Dysidea avara TaxID=196820 RepID=UPI00331F368D